MSRSVFLHFRDATDAEVAGALSAAFPSRDASPPWDVPGPDGCRLVIRPWRDPDNEVEDSEREALRAALGKDPSTALMINVSGRFPGHIEVRELVDLMLGRFAGVASDEYSYELWTRDEVLHGTKSGRAFFHLSGGSPYPPSREETMRELDRGFYDLLGNERDVPCKRVGCTRGAIVLGVLCRPHHFESIRGRTCPFDD